MAATNPDQPKCSNCGRFCGVVYRWRGPSYTEVQSCIYCGINPPRCHHEDGTVTGCSRRSTHEVPDLTYERYWCEEHAPDGAEPLPYVGGDD